MNKLTDFLTTASLYFGLAFVLLLGAVVVTSPFWAVIVVVWMLVNK